MRGRRFYPRVHYHDGLAPIIGIGEDGIEGLPPIHRATIAAAELIIGGDGILRCLVKQRRDAELGFAALAHRRRDRENAAAGRWSCWPPATRCISASAVTLAKRVTREEIAIHPHLSAFSLAAARLAWPLADVECLTFHGRPIELLTAAVTPRPEADDPLP